jgi:ubiquitin C-terminal hydrolase
LDEFEKPELLDEDNKWYCSDCKVHVQANKQMQIYNVPPVLVINLKRFKGGKSKFSNMSSWSSGGNGKLSTLVDFPLKGLDLSDYIQL